MIARLSERPRPMVERFGIAETGVDHLVNVANQVVVLTFESRDHAADQVVELRVQPSGDAGTQQLDPLTGTTELDERHCFRERRVAPIGRHRPLPLAPQHEGLRDAGDHAGVEAPGALVRGHRRVEQTAIAAGLHQAGEELGLGCACERTRSSSLTMASRALSRVDFEVRVQVVRQRQIGIDFESALERMLAPGEIRPEPETGRRTCRAADSTVPAAPRPAQTADRARHSADRDRGRRPIASSPAESGWRAGSSSYASGLAGASRLIRPCSPAVNERDSDSTIDFASASCSWKISPLVRLGGHRTHERP